MKLWSSQLWTQFLQLRREAWKIQDCNGVWTRDLAISVRRSNQLSYEDTQNEGVVSKETVVLRRWGSSIKQDVEKFLRRVQLKAFFHDKEDDSDTSNKDIFKTLLVRKSKWTPPEGQFASLDFFTKKCRHDIHKLKFNRNTKFSNLSSEEWAALKNLSQRNDIVVKSADKGGAVVVWRSDLYQKEALRQLSDTSFYAKIPKDLTSKNQNLSKTPFKIL